MCSRSPKEPGVSASSASSVRPTPPREAALAGVAAMPVRHLAEAVAYLRGELELEPEPPLVPNGHARAGTPDLADVRGQERARRALELAAAGGHNVLFGGPPGTGKTMLARRLPGILPVLDAAEALEVTRIHSVAGLVDREHPLVSQPPFRAPHHSASTAAIVGGGPHLRPGEASLAHRGVLLLDELAEFQRPALEALRQPLEDGFISVSRAAGRVVFPARFQLVATMNLCPCGGARGSGSAVQLLGAAARPLPGQALARAPRPFRPRARDAARARGGARVRTERAARRPSANASPARA